MTFLDLLIFNLIKNENLWQESIDDHEGSNFKVNAACHLLFRLSHCLFYTFEMIDCFYELKWSRKCSKGFFFKHNFMIVLLSLMALKMLWTLLLFYVILYLRLEFIVPFKWDYHHLLSLNELLIVDLWFQI